MSMFSFQAGVMTLNQEYQMSNALSHAQVILEDKNEWEKEFWNRIMKTRGKEVPLPIMVGKFPYWRGVVAPWRVSMQDETEKRGFIPAEVKKPVFYLWIADFNCRIWKAPVYRIRTPTDAEYDRHFREAIDKSQYRLKKIPNDLSGVVLVRTNEKGNMVRS